MHTEGRTRICLIPCAYKSVWLLNDSYSYTISFYFYMNVIFHIFKSILEWL